MSKPKKIYSSKLLNKHTLLGALFLTVICFFFIEYASYYIIDLPVSSFTKNRTPHYSIIIFSLITLALYKRGFFPEFNSSFHDDSKKSALTLSIIFIAYTLISSSVYTYINKRLLNAPLRDISFNLIIELCLTSSFAEETIFRGILGSYLMRQWKNKPNRSILVAVTSAAFFSLSHFLNLIGGGSLSFVLLQVSTAFFIGIFFSAVYIRSGSIIPCIFLHALNNFFGFITSPADVLIDPRSFIYTVLNIASYIDVLLCFFLGLIALYSLRKSNTKDINTLWSKKWCEITPELTGYYISPEKPKEFRRVEYLVRTCFWNLKAPGCTEHFVIHMFRDKPNFIPELSLVLKIYNNIIGYAMFVKSTIKRSRKKDLEVLTLEPICIRPRFQHKGYGLIFLKGALNLASSWGFGAVFVNGDINFFGKAGFVPAEEKGIKIANKKKSELKDLLVKELQKGFLDDVKGNYHKPEGYTVAEIIPEEFDKYDFTFPVKKKKEIQK